MIEISKLAKEGRFDALLIESTGVSEPMPVAETFTFEDEEGFSLSSIAQIDCMVTLVDAPNFLADYCSQEHLKDRKQQLHNEDERVPLGLCLYAVLDFHFECAFDGSGAIVGKKHTFQRVGGEKRAKFFCEFRG